MKIKTITGMHEFFAIKDEWNALVSKSKIDSGKKIMWDIRPESTGSGYYILCLGGYSEPQTYYIRIFKENDQILATAAIVRQDRLNLERIPVFKAKQPLQKMLKDLFEKQEKSFTSIQ